MNRSMADRGSPDLTIEPMTNDDLPEVLAIEVSSFAAFVPEQHLRFRLDDGKSWVQRPVLWEVASRAPAVSGA